LVLLAVAAVSKGGSICSLCQAKPESNNVYISVTEPVEPLGSALYLLVALRSFGSVGDRYTLAGVFLLLYNS
jgi:hypothetical protein